MDLKRLTPQDCYNESTLEQLVSDTQGNVKAFQHATTMPVRGLPSLTARRMGLLNALRYQQSGDSTYLRTASADTIRDLKLQESYADVRDAVRTLLKRYNRMLNAGTKGEMPYLGIPLSQCSIQESSQGSFLGEGTERSRRESLARGGHKLKSPQGGHMWFGEDDNLSEGGNPAPDQTQEASAKDLDLCTPAEQSREGVDPEKISSLSEVEQFVVNTLEEGVFNVDMKQQVLMATGDYEAFEYATAGYVKGLSSVEIRKIGLLNALQYQEQGDITYLRSAASVTMNELGLKSNYNEVRDAVQTLLKRYRRQVASKNGHNLDDQEHTSTEKPNLFPVPKLSSSLLQTNFSQDSIRDSSSPSSPSPTSAIPTVGGRTRHTTAPARVLPPRSARDKPRFPFHVFHEYSQDDNDSNMAVDEEGDLGRLSASTPMAHSGEILHHTEDVELGTEWMDRVVEAGGDLKAFVHATTMPVRTLLSLKSRRTGLLNVLKGQQQGVGTYLRSAASETIQELSLTEPYMDVREAIQTLSKRYKRFLTSGRTDVSTVPLAAISPTKVPTVAVVPASIRTFIPVDSPTGAAQVAGTAVPVMATPAISIKSESSLSMAGVSNLGLGSGENITSKPCLFGASAAGTRTLPTSNPSPTLAPAVGSVDPVDASTTLTNTQMNGVLPTSVDMVGTAVGNSAMAGTLQNSLILFGAHPFSLAPRSIVQNANLFSAPDANSNPASYFASHPQGANMTVCPTLSPLMSFPSVMPTVPGHFSYQETTSPSAPNGAQAPTPVCIHPTTLPMSHARDNLGSSVPEASAGTPDNADSLAFANPRADITTADIAASSTGTAVSTTSTVQMEGVALSEPSSVLAVVSNSTDSSEQQAFANHGDLAGVGHPASCQAPSRNEVPMTDSESGGHSQEVLVPESFCAGMMFACEWNGSMRVGKACDVTAGESVFRAMLCKVTPRLAMATNQTTSYQDVAPKNLWRPEAMHVDRSTTDSEGSMGTDSIQTASDTSSEISESKTRDREAAWSAGESNDTSSMEPCPKRRKLSDGEECAGGDIHDVFLEFEEMAMLPFKRVYSWPIHFGDEGNHIKVAPDLWAALTRLFPSQA